METQPCNIIAYLVYYGPFLNSAIAFVYHHFDPQCCRYIGETGKFTIIESKCETTADMIIFALTGQFEEGNFRLIQFKDLSVDNVMKELYRWNLLVVNAPCKNKFGGHKLIIIRDNDKFYIIQSYIFEYDLKVHVADETQIMAYIGHYLDIFNTDQRKWSKTDIALWKCITGITLPKYNDTKPPIYISWLYSKPKPFNLNSRDCGRFLRKLLEEALIKAETSNPKEITDLFGEMDDPVEQIINNIQQLLDDLNLLDHFNLNVGKVTDSGCLTKTDTEVLKIDQPVKNKILENECNKKITSIEVTKYLKNYEPLAFAKLYLNKEKENLCYIAEIMTINDHMSKGYLPRLYIGLTQPNIEYEGDIVLGDFNITEAKNVKTYMEIDDYTIPLEYDLMTMYYCYINRFSCMELDKKYAKNKVLDWFKSTVTAVNYEDMLVFLRTNAKIMGINVKGYPKYYEGNYNPYEIIDKKIKEEVKILKNLVRKRLESLD